MRYLLFLSLLWCSTFAKASSESEIRLSGRDSHGRSQHLLMYLQDSVWVVDVLATAHDGWPDRVSHQVFSSQNEANTYLQSLRLVSSAEAFDDQVQARELVGVRGEALWRVTQNWNEAWEARFAQWVHENADPTFFKRFNLATDCADVAYSLRWIFARINGLPVANRIGSNDWLTQNSVRADWQRLPSGGLWYQDKRFLAALNYLLDMTYTHTLFRDSYPISITPDIFTPGAFHLNLHDQSGHTQIVRTVDLGPDSIVPFTVIFSTTPRQVRVLVETGFWDSKQPKVDKGGFLKMRWPAGAGLVAAEKMPHFSQEQYGDKFLRSSDFSFSQEVMLRLKPDLDFVHVLENGLATLKSALETRSQLVESGFKTCAQRGCPDGSASFEEWSTPSRDDRIKDVLSQLRFISLNAPTSSAEAVQALWEKALREPILALGGVSYTLKAISFVWNNRLFSSDPNVSPDRRWALSAAGLGEAFRDQLQKGLNERKKLIAAQGLACNRPEACAPHSPLYQKWTSAKIDRLLQVLPTMAADYCDVSPAQECQTFRNGQLSTPVEILGERKTLAQWFEGLMWLNSDPRHSTSRRWQGLRDVILNQSMQGIRQILVSRSGLRLIRSLEGKVQLLQRATELTAPVGWQWSSLNTISDFVVTTRADRFKIQKGANGVTREWAPALGEISRTEWIEGSYLLVHSATGTLALFDTTHENGNPLWKTQVQEWTVLSKGSVVVAKTLEGATEIYHVSGPTVETLKVRAPNPSQIVITNVSRRFYFGFQIEGTSRHNLLIHRRTGEVRRLESEGMAVLLNEEGTAGIFQAGSFMAGQANWLELNEDGTLKTQKRMGNVSWVNSNLASVEEMGVCKTYVIEGNVLKLFPLLEDEMCVIQASEQYMVVAKSGWTHRLRPRHSSQALLEAGRISFSTGGEREAEWLIVTDDRDLGSSQVINRFHPDLFSVLTGNLSQLRASEGIPGVRGEPPISTIENGIVLPVSGSYYWLGL